MNGFQLLGVIAIVAIVIVVIHQCIELYDYWQAHRDLTVAKHRPQALAAMQRASQGKAATSPPRGLLQPDGDVAFNLHADQAMAIGNDLQDPI